LTLGVCDRATFVSIALTGTSPKHSFSTGRIGVTSGGEERCHLHCRGRRRGVGSRHAGPPRSLRVPDQLPHHLPGLHDRTDSPPRAWSSAWSRSIESIPAPRGKAPSRKSRSQTTANRKEKGMAKTDKPNILIMWGDDIGMWNVSRYSQGMMGYRTPNIDRIGEEG